jgi:hypothetical protein
MQLKYFGYRCRNAHKNRTKQNEQVVHTCSFCNLFASRYNDELIKVLLQAYP